MEALPQLIILLTAAVVAVSIFKRLGLGSILGYLAAGILVGPHVLGFITDLESIAHISELGIVLLLFVIGLELEPSRLWVLRRHVFGLGGAQVVLSTIALTLFAIALDVPTGSAIAVAFALSLSSTAFVMQILGERHDTLQVYGQASFGILLFQDLAVIPFLAILPLLAGSTDINIDAATLESFGKTIAALAGVGIAMAFLIRPFFRYIAELKSQEIFTAATLLVVIATALFMQTAGLSMSLGAFLAGVLLANSEYRHEIEANIQPFEGLLLGLFFMSVGMSANLGIILSKPLAVIGVTVGFMLIKSVVLWLVSYFAGHSRETNVRLALALPQGGEFAFVLLGVAVAKGILVKDLSDLLITVVTLSMGVAPLCFAIADKLAKKFAGPSSDISFDRIDSSDHPVIIAGFGRYGQIIARMLVMRHIKFVALESNQEQINFVRKFGSKIYYGDASRLELLKAASAHKAKIFVLAIDDVDASLRTAAMVKKHFPHLKIIARARNRNHAYRLMNQEPASVQRELFAGSIEAGQTVLEALGDSPAEAKRAAERFRAHDEEGFAAGYAVHNDEQLLIATAKQYAKELESIFDADIEQRAEVQKST